MVYDKSKHVIDIVHSEEARSVAFAGSAETLNQLRFGIHEALRGYNVVCLQKVREYPCVREVLLR